MIDPFLEELIEPAEACRLRVFAHARTKRPLHLSGFYRYVTRGARGINGARVRLEVVKTPRGLRTSREAVARFISALTNPDTCVASAPSSVRKREIEQAEVELREAGFDLGTREKMSTK